jgi:hypothetical protein
MTSSARHPAEALLEVAPRWPSEIFGGTNVIGEQLHDFDLCLCRHALEAIRGHLTDPEFAAYVGEQLAAPVLAHLHALGEDVEPPSRLLRDQDLDELSIAFGGGPFHLDQPWIPYPPLYRRGLDCVTEIRDRLSREHAERWAQASARFAERLEGDRVYLGTGIEVVRQWVGEARRLLRAMGALEFLPYPDGPFPTVTGPSQPRASVPPSPSDEPPPSLCVYVQAIRALFQRDPASREAKADAIRRQLKLNKQKVFHALRWLADRGEYRGHTRAPQQRDLGGSSDER